MSKCPLKTPFKACNRVLVNAHTCIYCNTGFHAKCLEIHSQYCKSSIVEMERTQQNSTQSSVNVSPLTANRHLNSLVRAHANLSPMPPFEFAPTPRLPDGWSEMNVKEQNTLIMTSLLKIENQNTQIKEQLSMYHEKINLHSEVLIQYETKFNDVNDELHDIENAIVDRNPTSEIIISGIAQGINMPKNETAQKILEFIDCTGQHFIPLDVREVNSRRTDNSSKSIVIEMISDKVCDKVLQRAATTRKTVDLTNANIFNVDNQSKIYVNKMLPPYYENLAYKARVAKKEKKLTTTWVNNGNVCVKQTEQQRPAAVATMSQLSHMSGHT